MRKTAILTLTAILIFALIISVSTPAFSKTKKEKEKEPEKPITLDRIVSIQPNFNYDLSPDGKKLLFVNKKGEYEQIFMMDKKGSSPLQITGQMQDFSGPKWSPDGKKIACISEKQIWIMDADGRNPEKLTDHGAGANTPRWSPDGKKIAFYSRRKGWDQVWVMDSKGKNLKRVININNDFEGLTWSPDGKYIAASATDKKDLYDSHIYVFPVEGGTPKRLTSPNGSFDFSPQWSPDGKYIAFISNRNGWDHLYRMNTDGSDAVQLSKGNYEHESPNWSPNSKWICYLRDNQGKRNLMKVSVEGAEPVRIDGMQEGINFIEAWSPDSRQIVAQFGSFREPYSLQIYNADGKKVFKVTDSFVQGLKSSDFPKPQYVSFKARDGMEIHGYVIKPKNMKKGKKYPAVIYSHGGPTWQFGYGWKPFLAYLAQEGYVVFGVDIRGSTGYGVQFQKANNGEWGNKDLFDLVDAKKYLVSTGCVDPDRVAIYGGSYGGYMTLCAMARTPGVFCCGIALYGDSDIAKSYKHGDRPGRLDLLREMGDPELKKAVYKRGSPVFYAENIQDPVMIQHGLKDMRVVPLMSKLMIEQLKIEGKFYTYKFFEDEPHGFYEPENEKESNELTFKFLEKYCKGEKEKEEKQDKKK